MRDLPQEVVVVDLDDAALGGRLTQSRVDRWLEDEQAAVAGMSGADTARLLVRMAFGEAETPTAEEDFVPLAVAEMIGRLEFVSRSAQVRRVLVLVAGRAKDYDAWFTQIEHPSLALLWAPRLKGSWWEGDSLNLPSPVEGSAAANLASLVQLLTDSGTFDAVWERTRSAPCGGMATPGMRLITLDGRIPADQLLRQSIGDLIQPTVTSETGDTSLISGLPSSLLGGDIGGGSLNPNSRIALAIADGEARTVELTNHAAGWSPMSALTSRSFVAQTREALADVADSAQVAYRTAKQLFKEVDASDGLQPEERERIERQSLSVRVSADRRAESKAGPTRLTELVTGTARRDGGLASLSQDLTHIAKISVPESAEQTVRRLDKEVDSGRIGEAREYAQRTIPVPTFLLFGLYAVLGLIVEFLDLGGPATGLVGLVGLVPGVVLLLAGPWGNEDSSPLAGNAPAVVAALVGAVVGAMIGAGIGLTGVKPDMLPVAAVGAVIGGILVSVLLIWASVDRWVTRVPSAHLSSLFGEVNRQVNITKTGQWTYANERLALHRTARSLHRLINAYSAHLSEVDYQPIASDRPVEESGALVSPQEQAAGGEAIKVGLVKAVRQAVGSLLADRLDGMALAQRSAEVTDAEADEEGRRLVEQVMDLGRALEISGVFGATRHTLADVTLDQVGEEFWKHDAQVRVMLEASSIRERLFHFVGGADLEWLAGTGMDPVMFLAPRGSVLPEPQGEYIERVQTGRRDLAGLVRLVPVAPPQG